MTFLTGDTATTLLGSQRDHKNASIRHCRHEKRVMHRISDVSLQHLCSTYLDVRLLDI